MVKKNVLVIGSGVFSFSAFKNFFVFSRLRVNLHVGYHLYVSVEEPEFEFDSGIDVVFFNCCLSLYCLFYDSSDSANNLFYCLPILPRTLFIIILVTF